MAYLLLVYSGASHDHIDPRSHLPRLLNISYRTTRYIH